VNEAADGARGSDDETLLADLFDTLLQQVLDGKLPDPDGLLPDRPDLRARVRETCELACAVAGRREPAQPVLGGYEIVRELGRGGMGTVYLARHQELGREVAIKVLPRSLALSPRARRRFLEEARALARLRHQNVVPIHRIVDHGDMLAFEMEYVAGPSLQRLLLELRKAAPRPQADDLARALGPAAPQQPLRSAVEYFVRLGIAIARALGEVHRRGLVHRDVKPSNILLREDGTPVLADFGLAQEDDPAATQTVSFAGTPIYAAPERLRNGDLELDGRADVYSLGVTLYEAITLSPPVQGRSTQELLRKIEAGQVVPLRRRAPHVSRDLQTVLQMAMAADPRRRYATADAFADDLERLLALQPVRARPDGLLRRLVLATNRQRKVLLAAGAGAVLVALLAWPVLAHARAAATAVDRAAQAVQQAHRQLLQPECIDLGGWRDGDGTARAGVDVGRQADALRAALAAYDEALAALPDQPRPARERAVVATALWLRTGPARRDDAAFAAFRAAAAPLPPVTHAAAEMLLGGSIDLPALRLPLERAAADDRFALGLLAALLGDLAVCEAAWTPLDDTAFDHPLLDAGLGRLYAADGFPERAYPRLFHATRAFPGAPALLLELADAALATGDVRLAEQWLAHPDAGGAPAADDTGPDALRRRRVAADLLAQKGDRAGAETGYRAILATWPRDVVARHRLATLAAERGDPTRARQHLERIVAERPDHAAARLDLARLALHERDRAGYLVQARWAVAASLGHDRSRGTTGQLLELLRLGGLHALVDELNDGHDAPLSDWRHVDPAVVLWPSATWQAAVEAALLVLGDVDHTAARMRGVVSLPLAGTVLAVLAVAGRRGEMLRPVPMLLRPLLPVAVAQVLHRFGGDLAFWLTPFQRSLGDPLRRLEFKPFATLPPVDEDLAPSSALATVGFVDGTEELLVAHVPMRDSDGTGSVEVRSAATGALLHVLRSPRPGLMFGYSLADVGDVDGDGVRDFAVGAPQTRAEPDAGAAVFVYSGRDRSLLRELGGDDDTGFGAALACLGDVDGDGVPDLAVGVPPYQRSTLALGHVAVFSGRTGAVIRTVRSDRAGATFGETVADVGDVDGDGCHDFVVGGNDGGAVPLVRLFSGRSGSTLRDFAADSCFDFGRMVYGVGDLDGDRVGDVAVTAPGFGNDAHEPGRVVFFSGRTGNRIDELVGDRGDDAFGASLCVLPDWRGDGRPTLAIGAVRGGVSGNGYVRVFDRASRRPLQSFFVSPRALAFGVPLVCLGDLRSRGRPRFATVCQFGDGNSELWTLWYTLDEQRPPPEAR